MRHDHIVAFGHHRHDFGLQLIGNGRRLHFAHFRKELHDAGAPVRRLGIVLNVALRDPLVGHFPVVGFKQLFHDVVGRLLVLLLLRVLAVEERVRIGDADDRVLGVDDPAKTQHQPRNHGDS